MNKFKAETVDSFHCTKMQKTVLQNYTLETYQINRKYTHMSLNLVTTNLNFLMRTNDTVLSLTYDQSRNRRKDM